MDSEVLGEGSVTRWISDLKAGDGLAAQTLWDRYFERLVRLARKRVQMARRIGADEDEDDAALSAFDSFCAGLARGRFPQLDDRDNLWRLLVVITARKASAQADRRRSQKRGGDWTPLEGGPSLSASGDTHPGIAELVGRRDSVGGYLQPGRDLLPVAHGPPSVSRGVDRGDPGPAPRTRADTSPPTPPGDPQGPRERRELIGRGHERRDQKRRMRLSAPGCRGAGR